MISSKISSNLKIMHQFMKHSQNYIKIKYKFLHNIYTDNIYTVK